MIGKTVCFFNTSKHWGGGEKWHIDMATGLARRGWRVVAVSEKAGRLNRKMKICGLPVYDLAVSNLSFLNIFKILRTRKILKKEKIDVLVISLPSDLKLAGPAARRARVGKVIYRRGSSIPIRNSRLNRYLLQSCVTDIIANSSETKKSILANNQAIFDPEKIHVIYNGLDLDEWDSRDAAPVYRPRAGDLHNRRQKEIVLGTAGRLEIEKGHSHLIDLAAALKVKGLKFTLLIAGKGRLRGKLETYAKNRGVGKEVIFTGFVEDMRNFMESIDIFALSSLREGFGYVLIEAMASRRPVVAFNLASTSEIIDDGESGFLVEPGDIDRMASRVARLAGDSNLRGRFGENGRRTVQARFAMEPALEKLDLIIST